MIEEYRTLLADGAPEAEIKICRDVRPWANKVISVHRYEETKARYAKEADALAGFMLAHLPGGLMDALFASLASHFAGCFLIPHIKPAAEPDSTSTTTESKN